MKQPMIIVAGPSGAGKSSFLERAIKDYDQLVDTVTYTTRRMRAGESEGHPYHFVSEAKFRELIDQGFFIEWAHVHDRMYGTPMHQLTDAWREGKVVIMDVDVQGAKTFKSKYPQALSVFILPPSIDALRQRVMKRDGKVPADLELRMQNAQKEMAQASQFDRQVTNDQFEQAYSEFKKMIEEILENS